MKVLALAATAALTLLIAILGPSTARSQAQQSVAPRVVSMKIAIPSMHGVTVHRLLVPLQTGGTTTPQASATPQPSTTPQPTATASNYPDPQGILQNAITKYEYIRNVHFEDIVNGQQTNVSNLVLDASGVANCTPAALATVKGTDSVPGTAEKKTYHYRFIQKKKSYWKRQLVKDKTHKQWRKSTADNVTLGLFDNPLDCLASSSSGSGSGSSGSSDSTLKDLLNLGPITYHGVSTWHLQGTEVTTDAQGQTSDALLDFYVSQDQFLPYGYRVTIDDTDQKVHLVFEQVLTQFGKKVTVPTPKVGATKP